MSTRVEVYRILNDERDYQDAKHGQNDHHEVGGWILIMEEYLAKARKAWMNKDSDIPALDVIRKVTAVGVACMEDHHAVPRS